MLKLFPAVLVVTLSFLPISCTSIGGERKLSVHTDFPGGSAKVMNINQKENKIYIRPGGDPDRGWPCWWYFRVDGIEPGSTITVTVEPYSKDQKGWTLPDRATYSTDREHWKHTNPRETPHNLGNKRYFSKLYRQKIDAEQAWFAWGPPFVKNDANQLIKKFTGEVDGAQPYVLATSRDGREIPAMRVLAGKKERAKRPVIWIQARQHAWESGSSWVGRGFVEWLMSENESAKRLLKSTEIHFVPIMDIDNVQTGNGGKNQKPHDHNRDWSSEAVFPPVRAAMKKITTFNDQNRMALFLDLHNPAWTDKQPFFFLTKEKYMSDERFKRTMQFINVCKSNITDPLPLQDEPRWTGPSYSDRWKQISRQWVADHTHEKVVALTLETSWNTPYSTPDGYMTVGKQLGQSIASYLSEKDNDKDK